MKKTKIAKILALIILAMMILPHITSCTSTEDKETTDKTANLSVGENVIETDIVKIIMFDYGGLELEYMETIRTLIYENYGIDAEITAFPGGYFAGQEKIATKLLAGDNDFDIYTVRSDDIPYYAKNGACLDLSSVKGIVENFDNMFDGMDNICSAGGKLCGVPLDFGMMNGMWECNIELAEKLGLDIERLSTQKMTWQEFYDFAVETKAKAETLGINDFYILSKFMLGIDDGVWDYTTNYLDYMNKKVENKTTEYVEYLKLYIKMLDEGLIKDGTYSYGTTESVLFCEGGAFDYTNCDRQPFPKPLITAGDSYRIDTAILAINPKSPNIEAAKKYLEYSISLSVLSKRISLKTYLLKDRSLYVHNFTSALLEHFDKFDEEEFRALVEEHKEEEGIEDVDEFVKEYMAEIERQKEREIERLKFIPTTNGHEVIAFMIKNGKPYYSHEHFWPEVQDYALDVRAGNITPEEFADIVYKKSKMLIEE